MRLRRGEMKYPIEIRDPELSTGAIMQRIRANLAQRTFVDVDPVAPVAFDAGTSHPAGDPVLDYHLEQADRLHNNVWPVLSLAPSRATQVPVIGKVWQRVREQAHRLVLYYVEMTASKQIGFNEHVVGSLNRLAAMQEKLSVLEAEVAALQKQLADVQESLVKRE